MLPFSEATLAENAPNHVYVSKQLKRLLNTCTVHEPKPREDSGGSEWLGKGIQVP